MPRFAGFWLRIYNINMNKNLQNQRGFAHIVLILIIAAVLIGGGYYLYTKQNRSVTVSPTPTASGKVSATPSPSMSATPNSTAGWKTYTNTELGISIEYPANWPVVESNPKETLIKGVRIGDQGSMQDQGKDFIQINLDTRDNLNQLRGLYTNGGYKEQIITIDGQQAYSYQDMNSRELFIYVAHNSKIYYIAVAPRDADYIQKALSTFKFIP